MSKYTVATYYIMLGIVGHGIAIPTGELAGNNAKILAMGASACHETKEAAALHLIGQSDSD